MRFLSILAIGAQLAAAIQFTTPGANSTLTRGSTFDLQWSTVDTDPTSFSVYLVNFVNWPPFYEPLDLNVETTSGAASVRVPCNVDPAYGYQFNAINGTNVYIIYAQTPKFSITGDACTDPPATTAAPSTCAAQATATVTVTVRGNSTLPAGSLTTPAPAGGAVVTAVTTVFRGTCPATIGWGGDYNHPVTLTRTPYAGLPVATAAPTATSPAGPYPTAGSGKTTGKGKGKSCGSRRRRQVRRHH